MLLRFFILSLLSYIYFLLHHFSLLFYHHHIHQHMCEWVLCVFRCLKFTSLHFFCCLISRLVIFFVCFGKNVFNLFRRFFFVNFFSLLERQLFHHHHYYMCVVSSPTFSILLTCVYVFFFNVCFFHLFYLFFFHVCVFFVLFKRHVLVLLDVHFFL